MLKWYDYLAFENRSCIDVELNGVLSRLKPPGRRNSLMCVCVCFLRLLSTQLEGMSAERTELRLKVVGVLKL